MSDVGAGPQAFVGRMRSVLGGKVAVLICCTGLSGVIGRAVRCSGRGAYLCAAWMRKPGAW